MSTDCPFLNAIRPTRSRARISAHCVGVRMKHCGVAFTPERLRSTAPRDVGYSLPSVGEMPTGRTNCAGRPPLVTINAMIALRQTISSVLVAGCLGGFAGAVAGCADRGGDA